MGLNGSSNMYIKSKIRPSKDTSSYKWVEQLCLVQKVECRGCFLVLKHLTRQQSPVHSSVISSQCMHLGVLSTASHAIMTGSMFAVYYKPRFSGIIIGVGDFSPAWPMSQWKSLKWHEPTVIPRPERISPWEIEHFSPSIFANTSRLTVVKNRRLRPVNISSFGIASSSTTSPPLNTNSSSRMRVDGIWPNSPLLRVSSSFSYEPRNNETSTSTQASVSGYAPFSRRPNNGEHDQVENEDESGSSKNI